MRWFAMEVWHVTSHHQSHHQSITPPGLFRGIVLSSRNIPWVMPDTVFVVLRLFLCASPVQQSFVTVIFFTRSGGLWTSGGAAAQDAAQDHVIITTINTRTVTHIRSLPVARERTGLLARHHPLPINSGQGAVRPMKTLARVVHGGQHVPAHNTRLKRARDAL